MRKLLFLAGVCITATACHQQDRPTQTQLATVSTGQPISISDSNAFNNSLRSLLTATAPQQFTVSSNEVKKITAKKGLKILVDADQLETKDGKRPAGNINVTVREITDAKDMILNNCPTVSDGRMLVSGGSYFIAMSNNGEELRVRNGKSIQMEFPKIKDDNMQLFYGETKADGSINWKPSAVNLLYKKAVLPNTDEGFQSTALLQSGQPDWNQRPFDYDFLNNLSATAQFEYNKSVLRHFEDSAMDARRSYVKEHYSTMTQDQVRQTIVAPFIMPRNIYEWFSIRYLLRPIIFKDIYYPLTNGCYQYHLLDVNSAYVKYERDTITGLTFRGLAPLKDSTPDNNSTMSSSSGVRITTPAKVKSNVIYYEPSEITNLGWINCDHFFECPEGTVNGFTLNIKRDSIPANVAVYIIFKNMRSMLASSGATGGKSACRVIQQLPLNAKVDLIIYSKIANQFIECKRTVTITKDLSVPVEFSTVPDGDIKKTITGVRT